MNATELSDDRTIASRNTNRAPASTDPSDVEADADGGSAGRIRLRKNADPRNDPASASTATGAVTNWTSTPPRAGPPRYENARLPWLSDCPSTYRSGGTI